MSLNMILFTFTGYTYKCMKINFVVDLSIHLSKHSYNVNDKVCVHGLFWGIQCDLKGSVVCIHVFYISK